MKTLITIVLSLVLAAPAWAVPIAGDYTIQFTAGQQYSSASQEFIDDHPGGFIITIDGIDDGIYRYQTTSALGTFSTNGITLTQWDFSITAYDTVQSWSTTNSFVSENFPESLTNYPHGLMLTHGTLENVNDGHDLNLYFLTNGFYSHDSFDSGGSFRSSPVPHSVPEPSMLWPTAALFGGLALVVWRQRTGHMTMILIGLVSLLCTGPVHAEMAIETLPGVTQYSGPHGGTLGVETVPGVRFFSGEVQGSAMEIMPGVTFYNLHHATGLMEQLIEQSKQAEVDQHLADLEAETRQLRQQRDRGATTTPRFSWER